MKRIFWQAHRGGGLHEAPDNTMGANRYAWKLGGIPEVDLHTTSDGVIVCIHDATPARTTDAPDAFKDMSIADLTFAQLRHWDAGRKFSETFAGEKVPALEEVFQEMTGFPERQLYLDLKQLNLVQLSKLIDQYQVQEQVIFTHHNQDNCISLRQLAPNVRTMLWIGGTPDMIKAKFEHAYSLNFQGINQIQFHLKGFNPDSEWPYELDLQFIQQSLEQLREHQIDLEVFPFHLDLNATRKLLDIGIHWFATDEPSRFVKMLE